MSTHDSYSRTTPHPLDPDPSDAPYPADLEITDNEPTYRFPAIESGRSFPLSFLVFMSTVACIFFAVWRVSTGGAIASICLISPGLIYTMWVVEQRRLNGEATPFFEQAYMWGKSTAMLTGCLAVFAVTFVVAYALTVIGFYLSLKVCLGEAASRDGVVMGSIIALPIACYGSIFAVYGLFRLTWGRHLVDPVDIRN